VRRRATLGKLCPHWKRMQNDEIAKVLDEIADMLELSGENFFRVRAYHNAARSIHDQPVQVAELTTEQIDEIPGIGSDLAGKITEIIKTGDLPMHRELARKFPHELMELREIPGLGPKRIKLLMDHLHIHGKEDLERHAKSGKLNSIKGFGPKIEEKILETIAKKEPGAAKRILYSQAAIITTALLAHLRKCRAIEELEMAGSFRRRRETIGDLDVVAAASHPKPVMKQLVNFPAVARVIGSGETKTTVVLKDGLQVDLRVVPPASFGAALAYFTGSKAHNIHLRRIAQERGLLLNEYGLFRGESIVAGKTEEQVYRTLKLPWIAPEIREDRGEIEAASSGALPTLVERTNLRGDLHTHSTYTDGRSSIEDMARKVGESGLRYFAVTDHSRRIAMSHGLDPKRLHEQAREIENLRKQFKGITILRGIEVDILDDGTLDLPDDALGELDWVVASVHYKLDQNPRDMTRRMVKAVRNRNVDAIGHPTGRLIGHREPSGFDFGEILRIAREEGCAMEIDSQPDRLDLTDTMCMAAKKASVKLVITSDAHSPRELDLLEYGVNQARRGWIEAGDVLNTHPLKSLRQRRALVSV
ncbi:MAG TPA: DNA polymerase/3'-5' exonuclease PolX, partial [Candidatus Binataceae bacterium]|nr:DNA polymerase/3'-5' exonuclease PolX [Candidatus Binataceae bacterium]